LEATAGLVPTRLAGSLTGKPREWWIHWILRIAVAGEFIGHGAFGTLGKEAWLAYYDIFGISAATGRDLMPLTGSLDIALGVLVLVYPVRAALLYMACWGLFTAALRPLAGEGGWELVERSYNYGVPFALLLLHGFGTSLRDWVSPLRDIPRLTKERARGFALGFRATIAAYLIGHGALGVLTNKPLLLDLYASVGLDTLVGDPATLNDVVGLFEIGLGLLMLRAATTPVLLFVLSWKLGTESLFITNGSYGAGFEVIERAGAYAAPLALICLNSIESREKGRVPHRGRAGSTLPVARIASPP